MNLDFTDEQLLLRESAHRYLTQEYGFEARRRVLAQPFDAARWKTFADLGWLAACLPEDAGGLGGGVTEAAILGEELGRVLVVEPFLALAVLGPQALSAARKPGQHEDLLSAAAAGETRIALAHGEAAARSNPRFVATRAERNGAGFRLDGHKAVVIGAPAAQRLLVSARTEGAADAEAGVSLFLVDPDGPGVSLRAYHDIDGQAAADITLQGATVPAEALVGDLGAAAPAIGYALDFATVAACGEAWGAMDQVMWITRDYLLVRHQYGQALARFQALQHRMADMFMDVEQSRSMLYRGVSVFGQPDPVARHRMVMAAKAYLNQTARFVGGQAVQLHGAIAVTDECVVSHYYKRLFAFTTMLGGLDFCLAEFGRLDAQAAE